MQKSHKALWHNCLRMIRQNVTEQTYKTWFDGDDTTLHIVHIVLILFQGHRDHGNVNLFVDTLGLQTILQDVTGGVSQVVGHLNGLRGRLDGLGVDTELQRECEADLSVGDRQGA